MNMIGSFEQLDIEAKKRLNLKSDASATNFLIALRSATPCYGLFHMLHSATEILVCYIVLGRFPGAT